MAIRIVLKHRAVLKTQIQINKDRCTLTLGRLCQPCSHSSRWRKLPRIQRWLRHSPATGTQRKAGKDLTKLYSVHASIWMSMTNSKSIELERFHWLSNQWQPRQRSRRWQSWICRRGSSQSRGALSTSFDPLGRSRGREIEQRSLEESEKRKNTEGSLFALFGHILKSTTTSCF